MTRRKRSYAVEYKPNAFKVTLIFPMQDNERKPFPESVWRWWHAEVIRLFSGFTDMGRVEGYWMKQTERNKLIFCVVRSETRLGEIRSFLEEARKPERFNQEAMYFEVHSVFQEDVR